MRYMNRREASAYLLACHGVKRTPGTLAKYAVLGGGPAFVKRGNQPAYTDEWLDAWAIEITSPPVRSTSELPTHRRRKPRREELTSGPEAA